MKHWGWTDCFLETVRQALTNLSCASFFVVAVAFYSFYYAWPYTAQLPIHITTLIVDIDQTPVSRRIIRELTATSQLDVKGVIQDHSDGVRAMKRGDVNTLITIPANFMSDAVNGIPTALELVSNGAFIVESRSSMSGISGPLQQIASAAVAEHLVLNGAPLSAVARSAMKPPALVVQNMYNTVGGYLNFAVPIVFCIIFQTVTLGGIGILLNEWFTRDEYPPPLVRAIQSKVYFFALLLPFMCIAIFWMLVIEGASFAWHGINSFQNVPATIATCVIYSFPIASLGLLIAMLFKTCRYAVQTAVLTSLPCVFVTGYLFPYQNIPDYIHLIAYFFPSTHGVHCLLRVSQAGASLADVMPSILALIGLGFLYLFLAMVAAGCFRKDPKVASSPYAIRLFGSKTKPAAAD